MRFHPCVSAKYVAAASGVTVQVAQRVLDRVRNIHVALAALRLAAASNRSVDDVLSILRQL